MDLRFTAEELAFRAEVRGFIDANLPDAIRARLRLGHHATSEELVFWQRTLNARGWATPSWSPDWGGPGWTPVQRLIFQEELYAAPAPEPLPFNTTMLGPVLIAFGSDAQKRRFLPRAANLDDWWCQGFSEPGSGSDLASLKTTARRDGDHYVVNGQKTWTTLAQYADWIFALVRTDPAAKKQEGISFILIDMKSPGVTVRPIRLMDGSAHVNEVFLDDVRVPADQLVGEENRGWDYAKFLLGNERSGIARVGRSRERIARARALAADARAGGRPLSEDRSFRERIAALEVEVRALEITQLRVIAARQAPAGKPDPFSSILKIKGSELQQATTELLVDVAGPAGMAAFAEDAPELLNDPDIAPDWAVPLAPDYLIARAYSIYGGSNEIQKTILAKAVLGL